MLDLSRGLIVFSISLLLIVSCSSDGGGGGGSSAPASAISITSSPSINASNQTTYEISGSCTHDSQEVTVVLTDSGSGSIPASPTPICNSGAWSSGQMDVFSLDDGDITLTVNHSDSNSNSAPEQTMTVVKDAVAPTVSSVTIPVDGTYSSGDLEFIAIFDEAVTVDTTGGTPSIELTVGSQVRELTYNRAGANEGELIFSYTIQPGDKDSDRVQLGGSINLNSGSIGDVAGNPAGSGGTVTLPSVTGLENVIVDTPPVVSITAHPSINISNQMTYETSGNCSDDGQQVTVVLTDSGSGSVSASPTPVCSSGAWSSGQMDVFSLDNGDITLTVNHSDSNSNSAPEQTMTVVKDAVAPTVSSVTIPVDGTYSSGDLEFIAIFDEAVTVDTTGGTPSIEFTVGSQVRELTYNRAGANEGELIFSYTIQPGDEDSDGVQLGGSINLNSGSIGDGAGNPAGSGTVTLPSVTGLENVIVDGPPALSITSSAHINISNQMTYEISGNCGVNNREVTVVLTDSGSGSIPASPTPICNSGAWSSGQMDTSSLDEGEITITVNHSDMGGSTATRQIMVDKDLTEPIVAIDAFVSVTAINEGNFPLSGTCSEEGVTVTVGVSGGVLSDAGPSCQSGTPGTWDTSVDLSGLSPGNYTVTASQVDSAGNTGMAFQQDIVKPQQAHSIALDSFDSGLRFNCVLNGGQVKCWGQGNYGQIGNGSMGNQPHPVTVVDGNGNALGDVVEITAGDYHACVLQSNGRMWCWGRADYGQLGHDNTDTHRPNAVEVYADNSNTVLSEIVHIHAGASHTCALKSNGQVLCWGNGTSGQLGNGASSSEYYPVTVESSADVALDGIVALSAGGANTCALKSDGQVLCWGNQQYGRLGNGSTSSGTINRPTSVKLGSGSDPEDFLDDVVQIDTGNEHSCAIKSDKKAWCWGRGRDRKFGNGSDSNQSYAIAVHSSQNINQITLGREHTCAILEDRTAYCWGRATSGQLGHGATPSHSNGVAVASLTNLIATSAGGWHNCAISASQGVFCWGSASHDRLGDGSTSGSQSSPVSVIADNTTSPPTPLTEVNTYQRSYDCAVGGSSCALSSIELALQSGSTSPSSASNFNFTVSGIAIGETLALYSDADCGTQVGSELTADGPVSITSLATDGLYAYYFRVSRGSGITNCSTSFLPYVLDSSLKF